MKSEFIQLKVCRKNFIKLMDAYSNKQLNSIPKKFNNNIIWNVAHAMVTQQLLHYYLSDNPLKIDSYWVENFKKGTSPQAKYNDDLVEDLKSLLISTADALKNDYEHGVFKTYNPYMSSFGYEINDIDDAIKFNNMHEAMHLGYILALKNEI